MEEKSQDKQSVSEKHNNDWDKLEEEFINQTLPTQSKKKVIKTNSHSTQETLQIAEIRDGIVILKDGSFKAVVRVEAVNFDLMSEEEREAVEYAYQSFLNSLYFPLQISIQSRRVDADSYLKKIQSNLKQQNNMLLSVLIEDYLDFIEDLIDNTDIMNKEFYVILPFYNNEFTKEAAANAGKNILSKLKTFNKKAGPVVIDEKTLDKARKELRYRIQAVAEGLRSCGIQSQPLGTQELIEMYYEFYNPETTISQPLSNFDELSAPFVSKVGDYQYKEREFAGKSSDLDQDEPPIEELELSPPLDNNQTDKEVESSPSMVGNYPQIIENKDTSTPPSKDDSEDSNRDSGNNDG